MEDSQESPDEIMEVMREKIRTQAQRLRILEQYKLLCESRIIDLCPSHPLPVMPDHIGEGLQSDVESELHFARSQIERLQEQLLSQSVSFCDNYTLPHPSVDLSFAQLKELYPVIYHQYQKLLSDKKHLEESLKAEIQNCEEQRTYIEVLKQSLEGSSEFKGSREEMSKEEKIEDFSQSWDDRQKTEKCLKDAAEALQYAEDEVIRLEECNKQQEIQIFKLLEDEKKKRQEIELLKENYKKSLRDLDNAANSIKLFEAEEKNIKEKTAKIQKNFEELENEYKKLEDISQEDQGKIRRLKDDIESWQGICDGLKEKLKGVEESEQETKHSKFELESKAEVLNGNLREVELKLQAGSSRISLLENENKDLRSQNLSLEVNLKMTSESLLASERNYKTLESGFAGLKKKKVETKEKLRNCQKDLKSLTQDRENDKHENENLQERLSNQHKKIIDFEEKLRRTLSESKKNEQICRTEIDKLRDQVEVLQTELEKYERSCKDYEVALTRERNLKSKFFEDLSRVKKDHEEVLSSKTFLQLSLKNQENSFFALQNEYNSLKCQKKELISDLTAANQRKAVLEEENNSLKTLSQSLLVLKSQFDESLRISSIFCSSFGSVILNSSQFSSIVSRPFKETLQKNNKTFEISLNDWLESLTSELESVTRSLSSNLENLSFNSCQLEAKKIKIQEMTDLISQISDEAQSAKLEIEDLKSEVQKKELEKEVLSAKMSYVQGEFENTKEMLIQLRKDHDRLQETSNFTSTKMLKLKRALDDEVGLRKRTNSEILALQQEKNLLNRVLVRLEKLVGEEDLNSTYEDILKENLGTTLLKTSLVSPTNAGRSFSYDLYQRDDNI